jgi:hypothetical protein
MEMGENQDKYIVYLTMNIVNNKIYIGIHKTNTPHEFDGYLGCGVKVNKPSSYKYGQTPFQRAVSKYGPKNFIRKTLKVFNTHSEACEEEARLVDIEFIKREDTYNITLGGNLPPAEAKVPVYRYNLDGTFNKAYASIQEASFDTKGFKSINITRCCKKKEKAQAGGYLWSYEKVEFLQPYEQYNKPRKVAQIDAKGNIVKIYNTVRECKKDFCGCPHVLSGKRKQCKGYTFKYID